MMGHAGGHVTQISHQPDLDAINMKVEAHRIGSIVRNSERQHRHIADIKAAARFEKFQPLEIARSLAGSACFLADKPKPRLVRRPSHVNRNFQFAGQHAQPSNVIRVLMADEDGGQRRRIFAAQAHAADGFASGKPGIHENASTAAGNKRAVAPAAAGEHSDANHQRQNSVIRARMGSN